MPDWTIRLVETPEELQQVEQLQRIVWPGSDTDVIPSHLLITAAHNGGLVLGAFVGDRLVGLLFGFAGLTRAAGGWQPKHCSHQMGIHPDFRNRGIGYALKCAQAQIVREQGLDLITWTYDPLLSANAHLNIARLGATCNTYLRDAYGQMRDGLNAGLSSDRFQVDWWIDTEHVEQHVQLQSDQAQRSSHDGQTPAHRLYETSIQPASGLICPPGQVSLPVEQQLLAEIPSDFQNLKRSDHELARSWRAFTREMFEGCFHAGYQIRDFIHDNSGGRPRSLYVLIKAHGRPD